MIKKIIQALAVAASAALILATAVSFAPPNANAATGGETINLPEVNLLGANYSIAGSSTNSLLGSATNTITFSGPPTNNETVTFSMPGKQSFTYTFEPVYTNFSGMVLTDTSAAAAATNLANAINGSNTGHGTNYGAITPTNQFVSASVSGTNVIVTALTPGPTGNGISVLVNSTNIYRLLSVQCTSGFLAQAKIISVNGCSLSVSYKCLTNTVGVGTNFVRWAFHTRANKIPTNAPTFTQVCTYSSNGCSFEQTVWTNVPASTCGNARYATVIGLDSTSTNSPTFTDASVNTSPQQ